MDNALRKVLEGLRKKHKPQQTEDPVLKASCPVLHAFLTETDGCEKGKGRETGTIWLTASEGGWKACLGDRDSGGSLWVTAESFMGLLEALERRLTADKPDWRFNDGNTKYGRAKRKGG